MVYLHVSKTSFAKTDNNTRTYEQILTVLRISFSYNSASWHMDTVYQIIDASGDDESDSGEILPLHQLKNSLAHVQSCMIYSIQVSSHQTLCSIVKLH